MTDAELLDKVKSALLITGDYQDEAITLFIEEIKEYLKSAGASEEVINSSASVGIIIRGVIDLWNYGNGGTELSPYFMQRAIQLVMSCESVTSETTCAGHTILCENGIEQPQAKYLQFLNSAVTTDIAADKTIVISNDASNVDVEILD